MKIFSTFYDHKIVNDVFSDIKDVDFSLFIDYIPKSQEDLSSINIIALLEPNEYFNLHDWTIANKDLFSVILTWDDKILNTCTNALFVPIGQTFFSPDQYKKEHKKEFKVAHLCGVLLKSYGHEMRHEILVREKEIKIPTKFYKTIGDRHNVEDAKIGKETVFGDAQYGIAIENFSHQGFFTEKILDCFLIKTIPIYWGCSNIGDFFNKEGIIEFKNVDDLIYKVNALNDPLYNSKIIQDAVEDNYQRSFKYIDYIKTLSNEIKNIFLINNI